MRNKLGDLLRYLAHRVDGRLYTPVQTMPVIVGGGGGGRTASFTNAGTWTRPNLPREDRYADLEEALRIAARLAEQYSELMQRLSRDSKRKARQESRCVNR